MIALLIILATIGIIATIATLAIIYMPRLMRWTHDNAMDNPDWR